MNRVPLCSHLTISIPDTVRRGVDDNFARAKRSVDTFWSLLDFRLHVTYYSESFFVIIRWDRFTASVYTDCRNYVPEKNEINLACGIPIKKAEVEFSVLLKIKFVK